MRVMTPLANLHLSSGSLCGYVRVCVFCLTKYVCVQEIFKIISKQLEGNDPVGQPAFEWRVTLWLSPQPLSLSTCSRLILTSRLTGSP